MLSFIWAFLYRNWTFLISPGFIFRKVSSFYIFVEDVRVNLEISNFFEPIEFPYFILIKKRRILKSDLICP